MNEIPINQTSKAKPKPKGGRRPGAGAPKGNRNGLRHGLRAGQLPADAKYIEVRLNVFRRQLEDAVLASKGEVSIADAAAVQTCIRWERHAALAQRWLNKAYDSLKPVDRLKFSSEIARASGERDKAIRVLGLDRDQQQNVIEALYRRVPSNGSDDDDAE